MIKNLNYFLQSLVIYLFFIIARIIGIKISRKLFSRLFYWVAPLFKSKKIINDNLQKFEKTISLEKKNKIIESMWKNYGKTFIEYIFLDKLNNQKILKVIGKDNLDIVSSQKPAIFISGHFANYELMSMEITRSNPRLATIYRPLNNIFLNPFMEYLRKKFICKNQIKKGINGVRNAIQFIKKNHSIAMMVDQRVSEGDKVNFFGSPALTTTLPAQLSIKFNLPIIPVFIERTQKDNFVIEFLNPIKPSDFKNKLEITKKLNEILENMIKKNPGQWIWTHNRWK